MASTLTNDEILFGYYSYDGLQYSIDLWRGLYESYKKIGQGKDPLYDKKCSILKFEIIAKFCHYAEVVGAFVYSSYAGNVDLNSAKILENLSKYNVGDIDRFYQDIVSRSSLDIERDRAFKHLFGYDRIKPGQASDMLIANSLTSVTKALQAIGEFYNFWKDSYNAYKHGYRLWFGYEGKNKLNVVQYLDKYTKARPLNNILTLPIDDKTIDDVLSFSKCCREILDVFFHNQKELLEAKSTLNNIEFTFIEYIEPIINVKKIRFNICSRLNVRKLQELLIPTGLLQRSSTIQHVHTLS
jgi:hypothetical protein